MPVDRFADIDNIGVRQTGNGQRKCRLAIETDQLCRHLDLTTAYRGDIKDTQLFSGAGFADTQILNGTDGI